MKGVILLSVEQCKRFLPEGKYNQEEIVEIIDHLYKLANIILDVTNNKDREIIRIKESDYEKSINIL